MPEPLTLEILKSEATLFAKRESSHYETSLFGVTDGKAVGTYLEQKFQNHLKMDYTYAHGNSAKGIDFPELGVDIKVTSIRQPQSFCPYKSASQKIYGLGYSLLIFVYDKEDDPIQRAGRLDIRHTVFVSAERTADWQTTFGLRKILENQGNKEDILAFFTERRLSVEEIMAHTLADQVLEQPPELGYLTISIAFQWGLYFSRVIEQAGHVSGITRLS